QQELAIDDLREQVQPHHPRLLLAGRLGLVLDLRLVVALELFVGDVVAVDDGSHAVAPVGRTAQRQTAENYEPGGDPGAEGKHQGSIVRRPAGTRTSGSLDATGYRNAWPRVPCVSPHAPGSCI